MQKGTILKGIGGFYYVSTADGIVECKARGKFRNKNLSPCVGDVVDVEIADDGKGSVCSIYPRKNCFIRPPVSNIDELIIVASVQNPSPDLAFIDKMIIVAKKNNVDVKICFNKFDLDNGSVNDLIQLYRDAGYNAFATSTVEDIGIDVIRNNLNGKITAFAGFSGVGKSSLLNSVTCGEYMQTGEVSEKLKRGKHTTRHVELVSYNGGYIVDTPGFSMLDLPNEISKEELKDYFPEFYSFESECKFRSCLHDGDSKVCAVCDAVENNKISKSRYENYRNFLKIISTRRLWK